MPLPHLVVAAALVLLPLPVQAAQPQPEPVSTGSLAEEIVGENCYVAREPVRDEKGQTRVHVEVLCD